MWSKIKHKNMKFTWGEIAAARMVGENFAHGSSTFDFARFFQRKEIKK